MRLRSLGFREAEIDDRDALLAKMPGTFTFETSVPLAMGHNALMSADILIHPIKPRPDGASVLADVGFTQDLREAARMVNRSVKSQRFLRMTYGDSASYLLVLGGVFDAGHLGSLASESVDWIWQHRIAELAELVA